MLEKIKSISLIYSEKAIDIRRHIHSQPELSFKEIKTAKYISEELDKIGIPYKSGVGGNGIVATLQSKNPNKRIIALRADFDALPIHEETNLRFSSVNTGVMHACGHDIHTSSLLMVAAVLKELIEDWEGTIHFVFQHAEELVPGGAKLMLEDNLFGNLQPECVIAQHVDPDIKTGSFGFKSGRYMASNDEIYLKVSGNGGHAAMPHKINDTVLATSQILVSLQQISSRIVPASIPMVLSFGKVIADGATNVIPAEVRIEGTFRTFDEKWRKEAHGYIKSISESTAKAYGTNCDVEIRHGYPVVENDSNLYNKAVNLVKETWGEDKLEYLDYRMTSEDFGFFTQKYNSLFYRLGVGYNETSNNYPLHSSKFNPNEEALKYAIEFMSSLAIKILNE